MNNSIRKYRQTVQELFETAQLPFEKTYPDGVRIKINIGYLKGNDDLFKQKIYKVAAFDIEDPAEDQEPIAYALIDFDRHFSHYTFVTGISALGKNFRGKGIARRMYNLFKSVTGFDVVPSKKQTYDGERMWTRWKETTDLHKYFI